VLSKFPRSLTRLIMAVVAAFLVSSLGVVAAAFAVIIYYVALINVLTVF